MSLYISEINGSVVQGQTALKLVNGRNGKKKRGRNSYFFASISFDSVFLGCRRAGD